MSAVRTAVIAASWPISDHVGAGVAFYGVFGARFRGNARRSSAGSPLRSIFRPYFDGADEPLAVELFAPLLPPTACEDELDGFAPDIWVTSVTESGFTIIITGWPSLSFARTRKDSGSTRTSLKPACSRLLRSFCVTAACVAGFACEDAGPDVPFAWLCVVLDFVCATAGMAAIRPRPITTWRICFIVISHWMAGATTINVLPAASAG